MAYNQIQPVAIDLFCGAGGLSRGLLDAGIDVELGIEINPVAANTYQHNIPGQLILDDIRNINAQDVLQMLHLVPGELFLLAGCPPCQTFSSLQKDNTEDDERNQLIFEYVRLVLEIQPLFIQLENVPGLKRGRGKAIFNRATQELGKLYEITSDVVNCADYGIPQTRKRLVMHGIRKDVYQLLNETLQDFKVCLPVPSHTADVEKNPDRYPWVNARAAFEGLPPVSAGEAAPDQYPNHETHKLSDLNIRRIRYIRDHGGSRTCLPPELQLPCHTKKQVSFTDVYGIIDPDAPAPTMTGGCITFSKGRYGHPWQDRAITVREAARLQSFDDDFVFFGNKGQTALQVGNAVPPRLAEVSGRYFLGLLNTLYQL